MTKADLCNECDKCGGTGTIEGPGPDPETGNPTSRDCLKCTGTGHIAFGHLTPELIADIETMKDDVADIKDKCNDIWEKINE